MGEPTLYFEGLGQRPYQLVRYGHAKKGEFWVDNLRDRTAYLAYDNLMSDHWIAEVKQ